MGVIKFGITMLIKEKKKSILYVLSMVFATALILNDFNILFNTDFLENDYLELKFLAGFITIIILVGGILFITFANLYFVYGKTKIISIAMISGRSCLSVGLLVVVQNLLLGVIGIITGFIVGVSFIPLTNTLAYLGIGGEMKLFKISSLGIGTTLIVMVTTLMMVSLIGMGYAYRSELVDLLKERKMKHKKQESFLNFKISGVFWWGLYFIPILCLLLPISIEDKSRLIPTAEFITLFSIYGLIKISIPQIIRYYKRKHCQYHKIKTIAFGNLIGILDDSKYVLVYLLFSVRYLVLGYIDTWTTDKVRVVIVISYVAVVITSAITIMYKTLIEGVNRNNFSKQLNLIGYTKKQINKIVFVEISLFYFIVFMIPFIHIIAMLATSPMAGTISSVLTTIMIGIFICSFGIVYVISLLGCRRIVFKDLEGVK